MLALTACLFFSGSADLFSKTRGIQAACCYTTGKRGVDVVDGIEVGLVLITSCRGYHAELFDMWPITRARVSWEELEANDTLRGKVRVDPLQVGPMMNLASERQSVRK